MIVNLAKENRVFNGEDLQKISREINDNSNENCNLILGVHTDIINTDRTDNTVTFSNFTTTQPNDTNFEDGATSIPSTSDMFNNNADEQFNNELLK